MVSEEDEELTFVTKQLRQMNEEKANHKQALSAHDQLEQQMHEIVVQERKIGNRLFET